MLERLFEYGYKSFADLKENFSEKAFLEFSKKDFPPENDDVSLEKEEFILLFNLAFELGLNNPLNEKSDLCEKLLRNNSYFFKRYTKLDTVNKNNDKFIQEYWNVPIAGTGNIWSGTSIPSQTSWADISTTSSIYYNTGFNPWSATIRGT